ncbi:DUF4174 domain-containing protein [Crocosphaera chwakensis]|uniref:DUF4174 domain-containing protein n=1 Tax=Crocosphaera chwakensis CCY0110 TaxID=391612 RepID=A3ISF3_9CHRO|nr:DUF4174 domain-containing protein [Crocosphaera chwakensis]EAZ90523.1 hypothetical protein CY0110_20038 [Crocosphaera chwakensis CCY0110]
MKNIYQKLLSIILFLGITAVSNVAMAQNNPLEAYRWHNRLLLVFVPQIEDERLTKIQQTLNQVECEFQERDLLLGVFTSNAPSRIGNDSISSYQEAQLRAKYGIKSNQFAVILIGKDGQSKNQLSEVPEIERIFGQIDNMPMRQQEISNRSNSCN